VPPAQTSFWSLLPGRPCRQPGFFVSYPSRNPVSRASFFVHLRTLGILFLLLGGGIIGCVGIDLVDEPPPLFDARVVITPATTAVLTGETARFEAVYYGTDGRPDPTATLTWTSSDESLATVDAAGQVQTLAPGQVRIRAAVQEVTSAPALLTIVADPNQVARVVVAPDTVELELFAAQVFTATALNLEGRPLADKVFTWVSADPSIATIDADGRAVAVSPGAVEITATVEGVTSTPALLQVRGQSRTGMFKERAGTSYTVRGTATLEELVGGGLLLSFADDFRSSSGPALEVYLSAVNGIDGGAVSLGALKTTLGAQTYSVPSNITLGSHPYVVIHCVPFNVTFGSANLR